MEATMIRHDRSCVWSCSSGGGFYTARNAGIKEASGNIICSLDDDDIFIRDNVIKLKEFLKEKDFDICSFPVKLFGNKNSIEYTNPDINNILNNNQIPSGSWFKKSMWEDLRGFTYKYAEDWDFWVKAFKKGKKFIHYSKPIYKHRMRDDSLSAKWVGDKFLKIREDIRSNYLLYE